MDFLLDKLVPSDVIDVDFSTMPTERFLGAGTFDFYDIACARDEKAKCVYFYLGALKDLREYLAFYYVLIIDKKPNMIDFTNGRMTILSSDNTTLGRDFIRSSPDVSMENVVRSANTILHKLEGGMKGAFSKNASLIN